MFDRCIRLLVDQDGIPNSGHSVLGGCKYYTENDMISVLLLRLDEDRNVDFANSLLAGKD